jgi:hypothetical protein
MTDFAALVRSAYAGRRFVCGSEILVESASVAKRVIDLGATAIAVAATRGTGEVPAGVETRCLDLGPVFTMMEGIRRGEEAIENLPEGVVAWIDAFDPDRTARVILPFFAASTQIAGRAVWGARDPRWVALDDKTTIDALWERIGVPHAPSRVVPLEGKEIAAAHAALDRGHGTVLAADSKLGWHGGAEFTRWAHNREDAQAIGREFRNAAAHVRVMPFLEGVPCSIHGLVFPKYVAAFRPCEMMVLRDRGARQFRYAQAATFWDPPKADREDMRAIAKRVGAVLRSEVGYRGAFTIDGVLTEDGFRPTELNPRMGAALNIMSRAFDGLSVNLLNMAIVEDLAIDWRPKELESALLAKADEVRSAGGMALVTRPVAPGKRWYRSVDGAWVAATEDERTVEVEIGPHAAGAIVFCRWQPGALARGDRVAPLVCSLLRRLDRELDLGLGAIEAAPDVRG